MARLHVLDADPRAARLWQAGRIGGVAGFAALLVALVVVPGPALTSLWNVAVPLLPASFFLAPALWRGVCPLSTLNAWGNRLGPARELGEREAGLLGVAGLVLFHLVVPARHLGLNRDGPLLAATLAAIAVVALALGARYASRSAFCNALCPVLPVERLYGQAPVLEVARGRCGACTVCTPRGCLDLADDKAMRQHLGPSHRGHRWLLTPFGLFAVGLPGFIVGYGLTPDLGPAEAAHVYAATLGGAAASAVLLAALIRLLDLGAMRAVALCAALSGVLYYWFTAPIAAANLALPSGVVLAVRAIAVAGLGAWFLRAFRQATPR